MYTCLKFPNRFTFVLCAPRNVDPDRNGRSSTIHNVPQVVPLLHRYVPAGNTAALKRQPQPLHMLPQRVVLICANPISHELFCQNTLTTPSALQKYVYALHSSYVRNVLKFSLFKTVIAPCPRTPE